ncbi:MAG TPA: class I SAM-dependent methyltransferase [Kofleriaceae bacterium]|nr:class I SAM-dependent methyltransferase [Kofleriaceae bacterium]
MATMVGNQEAIEAWNTVLFDKFVRFRDVLLAGLGVHGTRAIERHGPAPGARVVDIGCGFGDTAVELGKKVGPTGRVVGLDAAPRFIDAARRERPPGDDHVTFEVADIEAGVPGGPYDLAYSRMGTMFFASPVIALRNVRRALAPGGRLTMVVWRKREANDCMHLAELVVRELLGDPPKQDQVTCGPGPFSMASPDLVGDQLVAAGYTDIAFERSDAAIQIGADLGQAIQFALNLGPAGEVVRLAGDAATARAAEIDAALRAALAPLSRPDGVYAGSSTWIVTARPA